jgi:hypothetical protein
MAGRALAALSGISITDGSQIQTICDFFGG